MATLQQRESIYRNKIIDKFNNEDFKIVYFTYKELKQLDKFQFNDYPKREQSFLTRKAQSPKWIKIQSNLARKRKC